MVNCSIQVRGSPAQKFWLMDCAVFYEQKNKKTTQICLFGSRNFIKIFRFISQLVLSFQIR